MLKRCLGWFGEWGIGENGLYYIRARYYNANIEHIINQDILIGNSENRQIDKVIKPYFIVIFKTANEYEWLFVRER